MGITVRTDYAGKNYQNLDLKGMDLSGCVLFNTDLRGALLQGAKISLDCYTFEGAKFDRLQVGQLLLMVASAELEPGVKAAVVGAAQSILGDQYHAYARLMRLL